MNKLLPALLAIVFLAAPVSAQEACIGVFFDDEAQCNYTLDWNADFYTAYVMVKDAEQVVAGMAFRLVIDPDLPLLMYDCPTGISVGHPLDGIQIALPDPVVAFFGAPALGCVLTLGEWGSLSVAELEIVNHPGYPAPVIANAEGELRFVAGGIAGITNTIPGETVTWGDVKTLFR